MNPLVTIAIATYNVKEYIEECLKSVMQQTLQNIEILCIDDCSTDSTIEIIKRLMKSDDRIKLIQKKKNEGLSSSRNDAIRLANGDYICFIDGDDFIDRHLLKKAYELALKEKSNLVLWDYTVFWDAKEIQNKKTIPSSLVNVSVNDQKRLIDLPVFTWLKMIKTDTLRFSNISFPVGLTKQDIPFHWNLIMNITNISILPERLVYYRQRASAASYQNDTKQLDVIKVFQILEADLHQQDKYQTFKDTFHKQKLNSLYSMYDRINPQLKMETKLKILENLNQADKEYINSKKSLITQARFYYKMILGSKLHAIYFYSWYFLRLIYRSIKL